MSDESTRKYLQARNSRLRDMGRAEMMNTPNAMNANRLRPPRLRSARQGFTLIEILVALGIFSILLTIILVPLNMGVNMTRIGGARADTQQAAQTLMNRITSELRSATYVFPNARIPTVTNKAPFTNNNNAPYYRGLLGNEGACDENGRNPAVVPFENTSRIDFLVPRSSAKPEETFSIVTYYAQRADTKAQWDAGQAYDAELNPVVLNRAQIPFNRLDTTTFPSDNSPNALIKETASQTRYPAAFPTGVDARCQDVTNRGAINLGTRWLMHNSAGEPQLEGIAQQEDLTDPSSDRHTEPASNIRVTPLGIGLYAPQANNAPQASLTANFENGRMFTPSTTFICEDTNGNGTIDRVTVTLVMGKYDGAGAENRAQSVRLTQTVDLPNVESRFGSAP